MAFSNHDIVPDSPTNNFATMNPLESADETNFSEGNLRTVTSASQSYVWNQSTISIPKEGKWYFEAFLISNITSGGFGVSQRTNPANDSEPISKRVYWPTGQKVDDTAANPYGDSYGANDLLAAVFDSDNGSITFYKNGVSQGVAFTGIDTEADWFFSVQGYTTSYWDNVVNFGQDPTFSGLKVPSGGTNSDGSYPDKSATGIGGFFYEPPAGAKALCTANLPDFTPDVTGDTPQDYFKVVTYTGRSTTGDYPVVTGMQPDLVWIKCRNVTHNHYVVDSVNGVNSYLSTNNTNSTSSNTPIEFTSFNTNGFTAKFASGGGRTAYSPDGPFVAWTWKAGGAPSGSTSTTGSAKRINTSDTQDDTSCSALATAASNAGASNVVTPTLMSINQAAGFSIVKYIGTGVNSTVPHGLISAPEFVIVKQLSGGAQDWAVYHQSTGATKTTPLNTIGVTYTATDNWNSTAPSTTVLSVGTRYETNELNATFIAYCWHSVEGFSKFGSYAGNGSADGPFVYTGFRPAWIMIRNISIEENFTIRDSARTPYNPNQLALYSNLANGDDVACPEIDFLSNGFKLRANQVNLNQSNASGNSYIYMAFAEQPFIYSNAR